MSRIHTFKVPVDEKRRMWEALLLFLGLNWPTLFFKRVIGWTKGTPTNFLHHVITVFRSPLFLCDDHLSLEIHTAPGRPGPLGAGSWIMNRQSVVVWHVLYPTHCVEHQSKRWNRVEEGQLGNRNKKESRNEGLGIYYQ
ncbi:hypothetical protein BT69DRAFT_653276 [Atractiella rhizophila]|nr:hypothetical protein BT69DRAFT_653276 [Atractiella rhizophila]